MLGSVNPADFVIAVNQRRLACVIDPVLALGAAYGPGAVRQLAKAFECWLPRAFMDCADASDLASVSHSLSYLDPSAAKTWHKWRSQCDVYLNDLFWVRDNPEDSKTGARPAANLIARYEFCLRHLQRLLNHENGYGWENAITVNGALVDALALSASLDGAPLLTIWPHTKQPPAAVAVLANAGVPCERTPRHGQDDVFALERHAMQRSLAQAGLAPLLKQLPNLVVVRLGVASMDALLEAPEFALSNSMQIPLEDDASNPEPFLDDSDPAKNPWNFVQAWWYSLEHGNG